MLEINKCKLVPGITANWGEITGDITNQTDLVDYISTHGGGGGVAAWGSISGNISNQTDLMSMFGEYATQSFVTSALSGYATESWVLNSYTNEVVAEACGKAEGNVMEWVSSQGYLTSSALSVYATESWVSSNFLGSTALSSYATQDYVLGQCGEVQSAIYAEGYITDKDLGNALEGYATKEWVQEQDYATEKYVEDQEYISASTPGVAPLLETTGIDSMTQVFAIDSPENLGQVIDKYVFNVNGNIYLYSSGVSTKMYKLNMDSFVFELFAEFDFTTSDYVLWGDNDGNMFLGNSYMFDVDNKTWDVNDMGGSYLNYQGRKHNIIKIGDNIYMIRQDSLTAYVYSPDKNDFTTEDSLPFSSTGSAYNNFYRYGFNYGGRYFYIKSGVLYEIIEEFDKDEPEKVVGIFAGESNEFPVVIDESNVDGRYVFELNGDLYYMHNGVYKLVNGVWTYVDVDLYIGVYYQDYYITPYNEYSIVFGCINSSNENNKLCVTNLDTNELVFNKFYSSVERRLSAIESSLDSALSITNEILS